MILTEEQRDAIEYAISTLEQCGYEPEDLVVVKILQAMIDSSEHIREPPKMVGFDLEKARAMICHYRIENPGDADTDCGLEDLIRQANLAEEALDEIERLREALDKSEQILAHKTKTSTHWYEEGLQARADLVQCKRVVEQQAARIQELEDAHKRSGAKYAKIINELRSSVYANIPGLKKQWDEILNAPANGKIGPDAKPHCWQITEERKAAIRDAEIALRDAVLDSNDPHCWDAETAVLRGMLEEVA